MSSVGYLGFIPVAPGTAASAVAVLVYALVPPLQQPAVLAPVIAVAFVLGGVSTGVVLRRGGAKDPSHVVCDEVVGQWIALLSVVYVGRWDLMLLAFTLFRLFDVWKPPPVSFFDRRPGPWNVMMDDVAAGIYANLAGHLCLFLFWG